MSTSINLTNAALTVEMEGADRLWALKSRLEVPIEHLAGARAASDEATRWLHGLRLGGTHIPGVISAGRFYTHCEWIFWNVHHPDKAIAIELRDERYSRLVIEVQDPKAEIARIEKAAAEVPV